MPQLLLRGLDAATIAAVRAMARASGRSLPEVAADLLRDGLAHRANRAKGAEAVNAARTPAQRSEAARAAVTARWARRVVP